MDHIGMTGFELAVQTEQKKRKERCSCCPGSTAGSNEKIVCRGGRGDVGHRGAVGGYSMHKGLALEVGAAGSLNLPPQWREKELGKQNRVCTHREQTRR